MSYIVTSPSLMLMNIWTSHKTIEKYIELQSQSIEIRDGMHELNVANAFQLLYR